MQRSNAFPKFFSGAKKVAKLVFHNIVNIFWTSSSSTLFKLYTNLCLFKFSMNFWLWWKGKNVN